MSDLKKYWYISPIKVLYVCSRNMFPYRLGRGDIVEGVVIKGGTNATSKLRVVSVLDNEVYGNVELPLDRFKELDERNAYMED